MTDILLALILLALVVIMAAIGRIARLIEEFIKLLSEAAHTARESASDGVAGE